MELGVDLWGVGCVLGELFTGKPIMPGKTEVEQLYRRFNLCGSASDDFWLKSKLSKAPIFKPMMPYRRKIQATFHGLPVTAVGLMDTLLSIEAEYRGTAALALQGEFFTTEPFAGDPSSLPQYLARKEIDAKFQDAKMTEIKGSRRWKYARARSESSRKEGSENYTQRSATPHQRYDLRAIRKEPIHDDYVIKRKKWSGPLPASLDKMTDLFIGHDAIILKAVQHASLEKGLTVKGNDHDSKEKSNHSLGPSTSTRHEFTANDQISTLLPAKSANMQVLPGEHEAGILKDAQCMKSDKTKVVEGEDNQYFGPLPSASKPIDVDRILREHDRQIQEFVERTKHQKKLAKARLYLDAMTKEE
ncbi:hypothetical protein BC332_18707 [Capsicum chinense]|nr:hypothetical protein BC332_18707 [Capsicum chinense]